MTSYLSVVEERAGFLREFQQQPENLWSKQSIYRIPSLIRDLEPKVYEPRVVSIGPYHHGAKKHLQAMEEHKHRALRHFISRLPNERTLEYVIGQFRGEGEENFLDKVRNCYAKSLNEQWFDDDTFLHLMVLDGCFLLELLMSAADIHTCASHGDKVPPTGWCYDNSDPIFGGNSKKKGLVPYVKMDMLLLENQIPLIVLEKLAGIAKLEVNVNELIWSIYGINQSIDNGPPPSNQGIDIDNGQAPSNQPIGLHVLDVYRKGRLCFGDYSGWGTSLSAKELNYFGVHFQRSSGSGGVRNGIGSFKDVAFDRPVIFDFASVISRFTPTPRFGVHVDLVSLYFDMNRWILWSSVWPVFWWFPVFRFRDSKFYLPHLIIDESVVLILLNLMAFERLHIGLEVEGGEEVDMAVTRYVFLMSSLVRSEKDVEYLRNKHILSCIHGWSDESVVKLFSDLIRNSTFSGEMILNEGIEALLKSEIHKKLSVWRRRFGSDVWSWIVVLSSIYGLLISSANTIVGLLNYFLLKKRNSHL